MIEQIESADKPTVFIILGQVRKESDDKQTFPVHILLVAPDDDTAVRETLNALANEGYAEADLDQIGTLDDMPDEEPHASAYQGALEGEVSIINFEHDA